MNQSMLFFDLLLYISIFRLQIDLNRRMRASRGCALIQFLDGRTGRRSSVFSSLLLELLDKLGELASHEVTVVGVLNVFSTNLFGDESHFFDRDERVVRASELNDPIRILTHLGPLPRVVVVTRDGLGRFAKVSPTRGNQNGANDLVLLHITHCGFGPTRVSNKNDVFAFLGQVVVNEGQPDLFFGLIRVGEGFDLYREAKGLDLVGSPVIPCKR